MKYLYIVFSLIICNSNLILSSDQHSSIFTQGTFLKKTRIKAQCLHLFVNFNENNKVSLQQQKNDATVPLTEYNELIDLFAQAKKSYEADRKTYQKRITDLEKEIATLQQTTQLKPTIEASKTGLEEKTTTLQQTTQLKSTMQATEKEPS